MTHFKEQLRVFSLNMVLSPENGGADFRIFHFSPFVDESGEIKKGSVAAFGEGDVGLCGATQEAAAVRPHKSRTGEHFSIFCTTRVDEDHQKKQHHIRKGNIPKPPYIPVSCARWLRGGPR